MTRVAVVAHAGKTTGGGLVELRRVLEEAGVADPLWYEVPKSRKAPKQVKRALAEGAELVLAWAATARSSAASTCSRGRGRRWRSSRPARPTCLRPTSASRETSRRPWRRPSTAHGARSTSAA